MAMFRIIAQRSNIISFSYIHDYGFFPHSRPLPGGTSAGTDSTLSMVLLASHMILISSHTDILHDPHVKQICTHSQHTSAGLTILNVPSSPKQLLPGMPSLKVWSLAPHWMHSRRHCHWGDRYHASVFLTHQPFLFLVLQPIITQLLSFGFTFLLSFILLLSTVFTL